MLELDIFRTMALSKTVIGGVVAFSTTSRRIAVSVKDKVKIFHLDTGAELATMKSNNETGTIVVSIDWNRDNKILVVYANNLTHIYDALSGTLVKILDNWLTNPSLSGGVESAYFNSSGDSIVRSVNDHEIKESYIEIWYDIDFKRAYKISVPHYNIAPAKFSHDGRLVVIIMRNYPNFYICDLIAKTNPRQFIYYNKVISAEFSPDSLSIVSSSVDGTIQIWNVLTGKLQHTLTGHVNDIGGYANPISWSPDGKYIASGGDSLNIWDAASGDLLFTKFYKDPDNGQTATVWSVKWNFNSKTLATTHMGGKIIIWRILWLKHKSKHKPTNLPTVNRFYDLITENTATGRKQKKIMCNKEEHCPLTLNPLINGRTVKLSDGYCYSVEGLADFSKSSLFNSTPDNNKKSPMTRGQLNSKDIAIIKNSVKWLEENPLPLYQTRSLSRSSSSRKKKRTQRKTRSLSPSYSKTKKQSPRRVHRKSPINIELIQPLPKNALDAATGTAANAATGTAANAATGTAASAATGTAASAATGTAASAATRALNSIRNFFSRKKSSQEN